MWCRAVVFYVLRKEKKQIVSQYFVYFHKQSIAGSSSPTVNISIIPFMFWQTVVQGI